MPSSHDPACILPSPPAQWRQPQVDFDKDGQDSDLDELLRLGGLFPLARIQDRLPFLRHDLIAMAAAWEAPSPWLVCGQAKGRCITLIHLDRFCESLGAHAEVLG